MTFLTANEFTTLTAPVSNTGVQPTVASLMLAGMGGFPTVAEHAVALAACPMVNIEIMTRVLLRNVLEAPHHVVPLSATAMAILASSPAHRHNMPDPVSARLRHRYATRTGA